MRAEANIDWLTVTQPPTAVDGEKRALWELYSRWSEGERSVSRETEFNSRFYSGIRRGVYVWGEGRQGAMFQVSGPAADKVAQDMPDSGWRASRVDLALTLWLGGEYGGIRGGVEERARAAVAEVRGPKKRKVTLYDSGNLGQTLAIGSRRSAYYGRHYNKGEESHREEYEGAWRWEIECKRYAAHPMLLGVPTGEERAGAIASTVKTWFEDRGVEVPMADPGGAIEFSTPLAREPDAARWLRWFREQVSPCVKRALVAFPEDVVYTALGLRPPGG